MPYRDAQGILRPEPAEIAWLEARAAVLAMQGEEPIRAWLIEWVPRAVQLEKRRTQ